MQRYARGGVCHHLKIAMGKGRVKVGVGRITAKKKDAGRLVG